jgi:hypothetical protein
MARSRMLVCIAAGIVYYGAAAAAPDGAAPTEATPPELGVWVEQSYSFVHLGVTSTYSCDGLADKLTYLLRAAGARADIKARPLGCPGGFGRPGKFARVDLKFHTLQPPASGQPLDAATVPVPGTWRPVSLVPRSSRDLDHGDCELVEEFRNWLLPKFAIRSVEDGLRCVPNSISPGDLNLRFESFTALPAAPSAAR